jgi:hypothetical protein
LFDPAAEVHAIAKRVRKLAKDVRLQALLVRVLPLVPEVGSDAKAPTLSKLASAVDAEALDLLDAFWDAPRLGCPWRFKGRLDRRKGVVRYRREAV